MSTITSPAVSAIDRFGFTLFFATALHAVTIIGITFTAEDKEPLQKTIEVTLAQFDQKEVPKEADFIAQSNQQGSGQREDKALPATNQKAAFQDKKINEQSARLNPLVSPTISTEQPKPDFKKSETPTTHSPSKQAAKKQVIVTQAKKQEKVAVKSDEPQPQDAASPPPGISTSLLAKSLEMASLQAELDSHRELMAKKPRVKRLTSASTKKREDALYLDNWRKKIEHVGNLNYPEKARKSKLYGSLRLMVAINPDGSVKEIEVLESSGRKILDDAAIRIVRLAAPFQPFPVEMKKNTDLLEIIRTWKFEKKAYVY
ncbi:MAG: TonB family protein [Neptuniibacter sp.]